MSKIKGTVAKTGEGKFSKFVILEERDGFYFNTKFEPKCSEGDTVGIEYEQKGEQRGNIKKLVVLEKGSGPAPSSSSWDDAPPASSGSAATSGHNNRQDSIVWQSSRKDALVAAGLLLQAEAFKPTGKPDAKRTQLEALVDEITYNYFVAASDPRSSAAFKESAEIEEDAAPVAEEEAEDWDTGGDGGWED